MPPNTVAGMPPSTVAARDAGTAASSVATDSNTVSMIRVRGRSMAAFLCQVEWI